MFFRLSKAPFSQRVKKFAHCESFSCVDSSLETINCCQLVPSRPIGKQEQPCRWATPPRPSPLCSPPACAAGGLEKPPGRPGSVAERVALLIRKKCRMPSPRSLCLHKLRVFIIHRNTAHSLFLCHLSLITYASDVRIQSRFLSILGFET